VIVHGKYTRDDFGHLVGGIRPHVAALLSITPETWSHFLTEAWSVGLPVVATDLGAPAERLAAQGGGWVVRSSDPAGTLRLLLAIRAGEEDFDTKAAEAVKARWDDTATMSVQYLEAYRAAITRRRTVS
jgi:glycosyltransferase involved in cell wall biosynthesis